MKWGAEDIPDLDGSTIVVTGANSGLGLRSAQALAAKRARVLMACRNEQKAAAALDEVARVATGPKPEVVRLDLSDLKSVKTAAADIAERVNGSGLDVLMNNAGVMAIPLDRTTDGHEMQFGTNHLGHFALTGRLLPLLKQSRAPRVVTTSSTAHRTGRMRWDDHDWNSGRYGKWLAYGQSKLANLLFMRELDRRAREAGSPLASVAAHPGWAATHLQAVGPDASGNKLMGAAIELGNRFVAQSDAAGALPQLYAATMPGVHGGEFYGPDGPFEIRGGPKKVSSNGASRNDANARRLWEVSEKETGITYAF